MFILMAGIREMRKLILFLEELLKVCREIGLALFLQPTLKVVRCGSQALGSQRRGGLWDREYFLYYKYSLNNEHTSV